ncbi:hypothetical protein T12_14330 [Trichinella patagoniensis]|uniref:Uncharacterized protein n=1 Tax=Trichinella patagoniensis TaxID=990121 RepID=A0A0V0Z8P7_9BILA|nr:hypothetical protein T12_14330 [Trichinella patagoniensis]
MRARSSTTSLTTSLVISAVEVRSRAARDTPSLPGKSSVTTPRGYRARGTLSSNTKMSAVARWRDIRFFSAATIWLITAAGSGTGYSTPGARALGGAKSDLDLRPPGDPHTSGQGQALRQASTSHRRVRSSSSSSSACPRTFRRDSFVVRTKRAQ